LRFVVELKHVGLLKLSIPCPATRRQFFAYVFVTSRDNAGGNETRMASAIDRWSSLTAHGKNVAISWYNGGMSSEARALFKTVPKKNLLGLLGSPGDVDVQATKDFLGFTKEELASATNVPTSSVRYDRIPGELKERVLEIATICELVAEFFGSREKTALWFKVDNPLLGNVSPRDMIRLGRFKKLHRFVVEALVGL
jgi:hypothetical protein